MGISIELCNYDLNRLWEDFKETIKITGTSQEYDKFTFVLKLHGAVVADRYIILNNELYEDYNYFYGISDNLARAFGLKKFSGYLYDEDDDNYDEDYDEDDEDDDNISDEIMDNVFYAKFEGHKRYENTDIKVGDMEDVQIKIMEYLERNKKDDK